MHLAYVLGLLFVARGSLGGTSSLWNEMNCANGSVVDAVCCEDSHCKVLSSEKECHGADGSTCLWDGELEKCVQNRDVRNNVCCHSAGGEMCTAVSRGICPPEHQVPSGCCSKDSSKWDGILSVNKTGYVCCNTPCRDMEQLGCEVPPRCHQRTHLGWDYGKLGFKSGLLDKYLSSPYPTTIGQVIPGLIKPTSIYGGFGEEYHGKFPGQGIHDYDDSEDKNVQEITVDDLMNSLIEALSEDQDVYSYNKVLTSDPLYQKEEFGGFVDSFNFIDPSYFLDAIYGTPKTYGGGFRQGHSSYGDYQYQGHGPAYGYGSPLTSVYGHTTGNDRYGQSYGGPYGTHEHNSGYGTLGYKGWSRASGHVSPGYGAPIFGNGYGMSSHNGVNYGSGFSASTQGNGHGYGGSSGYGSGFDASSYNGQSVSSSYGGGFGASGYNAQGGSSNYGGGFGASGYNAQVASSNYGSGFGASSNYGGGIGASGFNAQGASSNYGGGIDALGYNTQGASSNYGSGFGASGYSAQGASLNYGSGYDASSYFPQSSSLNIGDGYGSLGYNAQGTPSSFENGYGTSGYNAQSNFGSGHGTSSFASHHGSTGYSHTNGASEYGSSVGAYPKGDSYGSSHYGQVPQSGHGFGFSAFGASSGYSSNAQTGNQYNVQPMNYGPSQNGYTGNLNHNGGYDSASIAPPASSNGGYASPADGYGFPASPGSDYGYESSPESPSSEYGQSKAYGLQQTGSSSYAHRQYQSSGQGDDILSNFNVPLHFGEIHSGAWRSAQKSQHDTDGQSKTAKAI